MCVCVCVYVFVLKFSIDQKTSQIFNIFVKCGSSTAEIPVRVQKEETHLNSIWMLGDWLKDCHWRSLLRMSLAAVRSLDRKVPFWCVLILKIACLGERGDQRFISFLVVCCVCYRQWSVEGCVKKRVWAWNLSREGTQKCNRQEKAKVVVASN